MKRQFLMRMHPDCKHAFADVEIFRSGAGWCYKCNREHRIDSPEFRLDLFICGPSCKSLSRLNHQRVDGAYLDNQDESESGHTYQCGFKHVSWSRLEMDWVQKRILTFDSQVYGDRYADFCIIYIYIYIYIHLFTVYTLSNLLFHPCAFVRL